MLSSILPSKDRHPHISSCIVESFRKNIQVASKQGGAEFDDLAPFRAVGTDNSGWIRDGIHSNTRGSSGLAGGEHQRSLFCSSDHDQKKKRHCRSTRPTFQPSLCSPGRNQHPTIRPPYHRPSNYSRHKFLKKRTQGTLPQPTYPAFKQ